MDLARTIQLSYSAFDNETRKNVEASIFSAFHSNPGGFMAELAILLKDENVKEGIRLQCAAILARFANIMHNQPPTYIWYLLSEDQTQFIKSTVTETLLSPNPSIRRTVANVIAKIATVEFPQNKWPALLPSLFSAAAMDSLDVKRTAIMALGFICGDLLQSDIPLNNTDAMSVCGAIYLGIAAQDLECKREALVSLSVCARYLSHGMEQQNIRHTILQPIFDCLDVPQLTLKTIQFFAEYQRYHFQHMHELVGHIVGKVSDMVKAQHYCSQAAIELINAILETEAENVESNRQDLNCLAPYVPKILEFALPAMCVVQKWEDNKIMEAAYRILLAVCENYPNACVNTVTSFCAQCLNSMNWKERQAACLIFSAISGLQCDTVYNYLGAAIERFFLLLDDQDELVVENTLSGLQKILEEHGKVILKKDDWKNYVDQLCKQFNKNQEITTKALQALGKLTQPFEDDTFTCALGDNVVELTLELTQILNRQPWESSDVMQAAGLVLIHLVQGNTDFTIAKHYLEHIVDQTIKIEGTSEGELNFKSCNMVILHSCLLLNNDFIDEAFADKIIGMVSSHFQTMQSVDVDGLYVISAMAHQLGDKFLKYFNEVEAYISHGLTIKDQPYLSKVLIQVIGDVIKAIGPQIVTFIDKYLHLFTSQFMQTDRSLKLPLVFGIGDCIRQIVDPSMMSKHIPNVIIVIDVVINVCFHLHITGEDPEYVEELREALREFFESLCTNVLNLDPHLLEPVLFATVKFVLMTSNADADPSQTHYRKCFMLLFDIGSKLISTDEYDIIMMVRKLYNVPEFIEHFGTQRFVKQNKEIKTLQSYGRAVFVALGIENVPFI